MYQTERVLQRQLRVCYPAAEGRIVLRTELDWERDVEAESVSADGTCFTFAVEARRPFVRFKPCLRRGDEHHWAAGTDMLLVMTHEGGRAVYPHFFTPASGAFAPLCEIDSAILGRSHRVRVYLPAGYDENPLQRHPVLYMQDGKNLFFPEESFGGREWQVDESLALLDGMNALDELVVVGIYSGDRMLDYTKPGYEAYGRSVVEELKPEIDRRFRVRPGRDDTGVMGSSLGGVVSFYMAWQWPEIFGSAACLSSTFSHQDDLVERVLAEPKRPCKFYLDSGWPGDNFETTLAMALALSHAGYEYGRDFLHLAFPLAGHDEGAWAERLHVPLQLFYGRLGTAARND
ncbi:MAG: alpha/beta hydrolase [Myxococcales bacterium]|nr:alpha/beta hydrolase [Myxococcales bacterium]